MIGVEDIALGAIAEFWREHIKYLVDDGIITDDEDKEYFSSAEYRVVIEAHMARERDRHRLVWFVENGRRIGACSYCIYASEDGKCFILDFWVFPEFRGGGRGHRCFEALRSRTESDGARYYALNSGKENSVRFWRSIGFVDNGIDEYGEKLFIKR